MQSLFHRLRKYNFELGKLSNLTPAMLGPKPPRPRNQNRVSRAVRLSPCLATATSISQSARR